MKPADRSNDYQRQPAGIRRCSWLDARCQGFEDSLVHFEVAATLFGQKILASGENTVIGNKDLRCISTTLAIGKAR